MWGCQQFVSKAVYLFHLLCMCTFKCGPFFLLLLFILLFFSSSTYECLSFHFMQAVCCHGNYDICKTMWFYPSFWRKKTLNCEWSVVPLLSWVICLSALSRWAALRVLFPLTFDFELFCKTCAPKQFIFARRTLFVFTTYSHEIPALAAKLATEQSFWCKLRY